jgi:DHA2 family multidrug resistance protein
MARRPELALAGRSPAGAPDRTAYLSGTDAPDKYAHKYIIAIAVTLAAVLELVDTSIVNVAIPHMMGNLGATLDEISWVSTGYIIANVIVIPLSSWLSAFFGRKRYLTGSIILFVVASFFCGAATSLGGLVFWRVVQGIGGGGLLSTSQATLFEAFPPEEMGIGQAMFGVGVMVGPTIGPTLGGYIVDNFNWPWIFYINIPLGILAAIMVWTYVHDADHQERAVTVDWQGIVLLALTVGSLQWMLERGERYDWFDSRFVTALGVTALASFVLLIWRELTIDEPVINFRVLLNRQLAGGVMIAAFLGLALYGAVFVLPVFLQGLHGMTANQTGLIILPGAIASAVTMAVVGRNAARLDARITVPIGAALFMLSMWKLSLLTYDAGAHDLFWPIIARGVGLGLIFVPLTGATMAELPAQELAQGTGMFNLTRQLGGSLGIAISATLLGRFTAQSRALLA